jgi:hypothetical protein
MKNVLLVALLATAVNSIAQAGPVCVSGDICISGVVRGTVSGEYGLTAGPFPQEHDNFDETGLFGGGTLNGIPVTLTFVYDLTKMVNCSFVGGVAEDACGDNPSLVSLAIGSSPTDTISLPGLTYAQFAQTQLYLDSYSVNNGGGGSKIDLYALNANSGMTPNLLSPQDDYQMLSSPTSTLEIIVENITDQQDLFDVSSATITAGPEPATWLILALGLGGVVFRKVRRT